jgi:hypothetical protein
VTSRPTFIAWQVNGFIHREGGAGISSRHAPPPLGDRKRSPAGQWEAGLVRLECLSRLSGGLGKQRIEIAHAVPPQAPIQA